MTQGEGVPPEPNSRGEGLPGEDKRGVRDRVGSEDAVPLEGSGWDVAEIDLVEGLCVSYAYRPNICGNEDPGWDSSRPMRSRRRKPPFR